MNETFDFKNPDYAEVWRARARRLTKLRSDKALYNAVVHFYKNNPVEFINDWGTTYDPRRETDKILPFILFPKQAEYIEFLHGNYIQRQSSLTVKSRDMGISWLCVAHAVWMFLFIDHSAIGFGSYKEIYVDKLGDPRCIFEKIRLFLKSLPAEFRPKGFSLAKHALHMKIINPANGATITGEAGNEIGRGGRTSIYFKDESATYERPELIERALSMNTDVQVDFSTPKGTGNPFYLKYAAGRIPIFAFHWRSDPRKDEEWYKRMCDEYSYDPVLIAQELDMDFNASVENVCIPSIWVQAAINFNIPRSGRKMAALDVADEGGDENVLVGREGSVMTMLEGWFEGNTTQTTRKAYGIMEREGYLYFNYDSIGVGAGVKGEIWAIEDKKGRRSIVAKGINVGLPPPEGDYAPGKPNSEMFLNLKAFGWWTLRERFRKTYEHKKGIHSYNAGEMISIMDDHVLTSELSQQTFKHTDSGKIQMTSKKELKKKGIKSPNRADGLVLLYLKNNELDYGVLAQS